MSSSWSLSLSSPCRLLRRDHHFPRLPSCYRPRTRTVNVIVVGLYIIFPLRCCTSSRRRRRRRGRRLRRRRRRRRPVVVVLAFVLSFGRPDLWMAKRVIKRRCHFERHRPHVWVDAPHILLPVVNYDLAQDMGLATSYLPCLRRRRRRRRPR